MKHLPPVLLFLVCLFSATAKGDDVNDVMKMDPPPHPRVLFAQKDEPALRKRIETDPALGKLHAHILAMADDMVELKPVQRRLTGRRLLGQSRTCLKRVVYLAYAYRMTGQKPYAERAAREMLAAARFKDWNPDHFLDVAEMTAALAVGYDWLFDALDDKTRKTIREAIVEKGLETSMKGGWWVRSENNWNQVCHGGLTLGALAVWEDHPELARQIVKRAVANVPRAMAEYAPDGAYPEGPVYWGYGTTYNVLLIAALQGALGTDFKLAASKGFLESSDYMLHVTGPTRLYFNYSDCGARAALMPAVYWFAARRDKPSVLWHQRHILTEFLQRKHDPAGQSDRLLPMLLLWAESVADVPAPRRKHWKADGHTPVAMHRSGWDDDATFVAVKGGSPSTNHAHMDVGSFVMDALGVRWAEDLGMQSYHSLESKGLRLWDRSQKGQRWTVFRLNNFSHNTLVVDGKLQRVAGKAPIVAFVDTGAMPHTVVDLGDLYKGQLASARRGVGLRRDGSVLVQDEIETLKRKTTVRWGMVTRARVKLVDNRTAVLTRDGKHLVLTVQSPAEAQLELYDTAKPAQDHDHPNPGTRMIGFTAELPASTETTLVIWLKPGESGGKPLDLHPLSKW